MRLRRSRATMRSPPRAGMIVSAALGARTTGVEARTGAEEMTGVLMMIGVEMMTGVTTGVVETMAATGEGTTGGVTDTMTGGEMTGAEETIGVVTTGVEMTTGAEGKIGVEVDMTIGEMIGETIGVIETNPEKTTEKRRKRKRSGDLNGMSKRMQLQALLWPFQRCLRHPT